MNSVHQLIKGKTYRVKKEFMDYDHLVHPVGKTWEFLETNFLPYESGRSLFVLENGKREHYRFQQIEEEQEELMNNFMDYVEEV
ncbi:DUF3601 domain-containing protein [Flavobacterium sp. '19STA2R22 D10 B1']|uniref:DUF3601 domain-containing protein n=1 Tax=Flavobacterium aerium TaxID=3037261 RepID=UPI00278C552E|nr:DUF3601 domain-containing protein [Flavobacterium sp. '19STA2R22 D10 B1']